MTGIGGRAGPRDARLLGSAVTCVGRCWGRWHRFAGPVGWRSRWSRVLEEIRRKAEERHGRGDAPWDGVGAVAKVLSARLAPAGRLSPGRQSLRTSDGYKAGGGLEGGRDLFFWGIHFQFQFAGRSKRLYSALLIPSPQ